LSQTNSQCHNTNQMISIFFHDQKEFRRWLEKNHKSESELLVGYFKVSSKKPSMTWSQSVDEALCFGWIDGVRRSIDNESYCIRFTPRKSTSIWSNINIKKAEELKRKGLMKQSGLEVFNNRKTSKSGIYSFENETSNLKDSFENTFKASKLAWEFFLKQAPSYQKTIFHWIMSAKQEKTQLSRLNKTIVASKKQQRIY
jgi:uncharacterized protein YdeI (YjbR/CyaY-like superfamily)